MHKHFVVRICATQLGDGVKGLQEWRRFSASLPGGKRLWEWSRLPALPPGGEGLWEWSRLSASLRGKGLRKWRKLGHLLSARRDSSDVRMVWAMLRAMLFRRDKDGDGS
jgi:hypothetical protein